MIRQQLAQETRTCSSGRLYFDNNRVSVVIENGSVDDVTIVRAALDASTGVWEVEYSTNNDGWDLVSIRRLYNFAS